jgi:N-glycosylase/DNA lyase
MIQQCVYKDKIENTVRKIADQVETVSNSKWKRISEKSLFKEVVACILGSKARFEIASKCLKDLNRLNLINPSLIVINTKKSQNQIYKSLKKNGYLYSKSKSLYIVETAKNIYLGEETTLKEILTSCCSDHEAREMLVRLCKGIGQKQASLFLRNIHYSDSLAILDSHVIKFMRIQGIQKNIKSAPSKTDYIKYEASLRLYADNLGRTLAQLDVAIWIVMRVVQRDLKWL